MLRKKAKKSIIFGLIILTLLFFVGCDDTYTFTQPDGNADGRIIGSIHGFITDYNGNVQLENVRVVIISGGIQDTVYTDAQGYYSITDLTAGDYELSFYKDSEYTSCRAFSYIPSVLDLGGEVAVDLDYHYSTHLNVDLYGLTAGLSATVWGEQGYENNAIMAGVTVIADFGDYNIFNSMYSTVTNDEGNFSFENLPATEWVDLIIYPFNDGTNNYSTWMMNNIPLIPNYTANVENPIVLEVATDDPFIVSNNFELDFVGLEDALEATFSKTMIPSSFDITINNGNVAFEESWNEEHVSLTINPFFPLQPNETYNLSIIGNALDNSSFSETYDFNTAAGIEFLGSNFDELPGNMENFPIDSNIELYFTMPVDLSNNAGYVRLYDGNNVEVITELSIDSNSLIINPQFDLYLDENYTLNYRVYSSISEDYTSDSFSFGTVEGIEFLGSNYELQFNMENFPVESDFILYFTMPVDLSNNAGYVRLSDGNNVEVITELSIDSNSLIINPQFDLLYSQSYTLDYKVYSSISGDYTSDNNYSFATVSEDISIPGQVDGFALEVDDWIADWNTDDVDFKWNRVDNAESYRVYAKDTHNNPEFLLIDEFNNQDYSTVQHHNVDLPSVFDWYNDDVIQTPFTFETTVTFKVVALNDAGSGLFSETITVADETAPDSLFATLTQSGTANNPDTLDVMTFEIDFQAQEYLAIEFIPEVEFIDIALPDTTYNGTLEPSAATFLWDDDLKGGTFTITVPAGASNVVGDAFKIDGWKDSSGNTVTGPTRIILY